MVHRKLLFLPARQLKCFHLNPARMIFIAIAAGGANDVCAITSLELSHC